MSELNFEYVPLTFISENEEIKRQIRHTLIFLHILEKYNQPTRLQNLLESTQYGYIASAQETGRNRFLRISDIRDGQVDWNTVPFCDCDKEEVYVLEKDDILVARTGGTTGKSFKIESPEPGAVFAGYLIRLRARPSVNPDYLYMFLNSYAYWSQIVNLNERNFRPKANAENLKNLLIPNCPRQVQDEVFKLSQGEKISGYEELTARIEEVLAEYDKNQELNFLLDHQSVLVDSLQQAILQDAVQGKLTAAWRKQHGPAIETAADLLARIRSEKAELVKARKIKKEKPLPPVSREEMPFDLPDGWVWCRLGEVCEKIHYGMTASANFNKKDIRLLRITDIQDNKVTWNDVPGCEYSLKDIETYELKNNDILIARTGGTIGKSFLVNNLELTALFASYLIRLVPSGMISAVYVKRFIECPLYWQQLTKASWGAGQPNVNGSALSNLLIPLPPLSEQQAIVEAVEGALEKVGQLRQQLDAQRETAGQLLKALLHGAFRVEEEV